MRKAILTVPENIEGMEMQTNGVHPVVLLNALNMMQKHFAKQLIEMAKKEVGDNAKLQEQWLDRVTKKYLGENPGDLGLDPNLFN